jgi:predicted transposase YdaD
MHPIYLRKSDSPTVRQNDYKQGKTSHQFEVIRLWEQPSEPLLKAPGLFPFAILAQAEKQENLLRQIAQEIEQISDSREQSNLAASTAILAGLVLRELHKKDDPIVKWFDKGFPQTTLANGEVD